MGDMEDDQKIKWRREVIDDNIRTPLMTPIPFPIISLADLERLCDLYDSAFPMFGDQGRRVFEWIERHVNNV